MSGAQPPQGCPSVLRWGTSGGGACPSVAGCSRHQPTPMFAAPPNGPEPLGKLAGFGPPGPVRGRPLQTKFRVSRGDHEPRVGPAAGDSDSTTGRARSPRGLAAPWRGHGSDGGERLRREPTTPRRRGAERGPANLAAWRQVAAGRRRVGRPRSPESRYWAGGLRVYSQVQVAAAAAAAAAAAVRRWLAEALLKHLVLRRLRRRRTRTTQVTGPSHHEQCGSLRVGPGWQPSPHWQALPETRRRDGRPVSRAGRMMVCERRGTDGHWSGGRDEPRRTVTGRSRSRSGPGGRLAGAGGPADSGSPRRQSKD